MYYNTLQCTATHCNALQHICVGAAVAGFENSAMRAVVIDMSGVTELDTDGMCVYLTQTVCVYI